MLSSLGSPKEAEAAYREAIRLNPNSADAHKNLGNLLNSRGRLKEAEAFFLEAVRLKPDYAEAHFYLGTVQFRQGRFREAEAAYREALHFQPGSFVALKNLGDTLIEVGRFTEAEVFLRRAVSLKPADLSVAVNLGQALAGQGKWLEAIEVWQRGRNTLPAGHPTRGWFDRSIQLAETADRFAPRLPGLLAGRMPPQDAKEALTMAQLCQSRFQRRNATAARLYRVAFAADPEAPANLDAAHRYNAACAAALAAAGRGNDAGGLDPEEAAHLRDWALGWLRDHLAARQRLANGGPEDFAKVGRSLIHWQTDPDLAGVRDPSALAALPADERERWRRLWADVTALLWQIAEAD